MKLINSENRLFKVLNKMVLLALIVEVFGPGVQAYGQIDDLPVTDKSYNLEPSTERVSDRILEFQSSAIQTSESKNIPGQSAKKRLLVSDEVSHSNQSMAVLSNGQPESSGFSIGVADGLIDEFTGDFTYSIPVMDLEGYPLILNYNSNVSMTDEASWVGLGWNLNVGSVSREMRGIPDEFDGTQNINRTSSQMPDITTNGYKRGFYASLGSQQGSTFTMGLGISGSFLKGSYQNTYLGLGKTYDITLGVNASIGLNLGVGDLSLAGVSASAGYQGELNIDSKRGINIGFGPNYSAGAYLGPRVGGTVFGISGDVYGSQMFNFNSRSGLTGLTNSRGWSFDGTIGGVSSGVSSTITFGSQTSVPRLTLNSRGTSTSTTKDRYFDAGAITIGTQKIYYGSSVDQLSINHVVQQPALGYFHSSKKLVSSSTSLPIMDFNRSILNTYSESMTNLPFSMQTFDVFYVNAVGMQGTFRGQRSDVGTYVDGDVSSEINGADALTKNGFQLVWPTIKKEAGTTTSFSSTESTEFEKSNGVNVFEFATAENPQNKFDAALYFKAIGEQTPKNLSSYSDLGGISPSRPVLTASGNDIYLTNEISAKNGSGYTMPGSGQMNLEAPIVATYFQPITVKEMWESPNSIDHEFYTYPTTGSYSATAIDRNLRDLNVLTKVEVVSTGGTRYSYGIPNYSNSQSEVMFNIGNPGSTPSLTPNLDGTIQYSPGVDNSVSNGKGLANMYDKTTLPAYASSFLLSEIYSSDYIDRTNNGPSLDDIGSYYKFNYTRVYDHFTWRAPMGINKAFYTEGTLGSELDDVASYIYGDKEIWYSHSVESKNLIAEFVLENRTDGYGSTENGALNGQQLKVLKRIELYNRNERLGTNGNLAKPLQVVEFEYTYELCRNYPGNTNTSGPNSGKLTLKGIKFYNGISKETAFSKYDFQYSTNNPTFDYQNVDGWGNYKPNIALKPNGRFPYAEQDQTAADNNSKAWKLVQITVPSGGKLTIDYEADSYAYVQDKRAMKHIELNSFTNIFDIIEMKNSNALNLNRTYNHFSTPSGNISTSIPIESLAMQGIPFEQYGELNINAIPNNIVVFKLETALPGSEMNPNQKVKDQYFTDGSSVMKELMVKLQANVKTGLTNVTELVPVFCTIAEDQVNPINGYMSFGSVLPSIGVLPVSTTSGQYEYGYVIVEPVKVGANILDLFTMGEDTGLPVLKESFSPFQRACNDFFVRNLSDIVYGNTAFTSPTWGLDILTGLGIDINKAMRLLGYAPSVTSIAQNLDNDSESDASRLNSLRIYAPSNIKYGGNARVKSLTYSDNWNTISTEAASSYQWNYSYGSDADTKGVASYESRVLRDESAFYMWDTYYNIRMLYPDELQYTPTPVGELLYPSGVVGYSRISSSFQSPIDRGSAVKEFYTARDFPTYFDKTDIGKKSVKDIDKKAGRSISVFGFTQGFSIETNDFHGKPKSEIVGKGDFMNGNGEILSRIKYNYYGLHENVKVMDRSGNVTEEQIAVECDIHADSRKIVNEFISSYYGLERRWYLPSPFSAKFYRKYNSYMKSSFYTHALIKHTNRSAVLKNVETEYLNAISSSEVIVLDKYSGNNVLTSSTNDFDDKIYEVNYPAHWYYREFRNLQESDGRTVTISFNGTGVTTSNIIEQLTPGDQILFSTGQKAWFARIYPENGGFYKLIEQDGSVFNDLPNGTYTVRIIKSNRSNQLGESMQGLSTSKNPLNGLTFTFPETDILNASALTFRDRLNALCDVPSGDDKMNNNAVNWGAMYTNNPYLYGFRGDLVPRNKLVWQSERNQDVAAHGVRVDGTYVSGFIPFFKKATSGFWYPLDHDQYPGYTGSIANWRKTGSVTEYNQYGKPIEFKSPLGVYSSALYGFSNTLAILAEASAANARQQEIAYEGFEDFNYYTGQVDYTPHFELTNNLTANRRELDNTVRHSGNTSLKLFSGYFASSSYKVGIPYDADEITRTKEMAPYVAECDCIPPFSPTPGEYVIGGWIKQLTSMHGYLEVIVKDGNGVTLFTQIYYAQGSELDGWQRIEGNFTVASNAVTVEVRAVNNGAGSLNVDDIRIHPFLAAMSTVVIDPNTLLKTASHDSYNYTTFYNYDENMNLVRVRVETEKGIITLSEKEISTFKF